MDHYNFLGPDPIKWKRLLLICGFSEVYEIPFDVVRLIDQKDPKSHEHNPFLLDHAFYSFLDTVHNAVCEDMYFEELIPSMKQILHPPSGITDLLADGDNGFCKKDRDHIRDVWSVDSTFECIICGNSEYECTCVSEWVEAHYDEWFKPIYVAASYVQLGISHLMSEGVYSSWKEWEETQGGFDIGTEENESVSSVGY